MFSGGRRRTNTVLPELPCSNKRGMSVSHLPNEVMERIFDCVGVSGQHQPKPPLVAWVDGAEDNLIPEEDYRNDLRRLAQREQQDNGNVNEIPVEEQTLANFGYQWEYCAVLHDIDDRLRERNRIGGRSLRSPILQAWAELAKTCGALRPAKGVAGRPTLPPATPSCHSFGPVTQRHY